jgi:hypothetical protein
MTHKEALADKKKPDQSTVKRFYLAGYFETSDETNHESNEQELLPTRITENGRRLLE